MVTVDDARAFFQERHPWMVRVLTPVFRATHPRDPEAVDEAIANTIALAWENIHRQAALGKIADAGMLVRFLKQSLWWAVRHTHAGRMPHRKAASDLFDRLRSAQGLYLDQFIGAGTPVPEEVAFRIDVPAFFATLSDRQKLLAWDLLAGGRTSDVAAKFGVTPAAVSLFRRRFLALWREFFAEN